MQNSHEHEHKHKHKHKHEYGPRHEDDGQQQMLDLDAEVFGDNLSAVLDSAQFDAARTIVDLGAGTGAGSRLLRSRYPDAHITCVDNDPRMLDLLQKQGFATVAADLDDGFPAFPGQSDLIWASSSLHHVADPEKLLRGVRQALASGGVLLVAELQGLPRFLTGGDEADLEMRCHAAAAADGWNRFPDWTPALKAAGFAVTSSQVSTTASDTPAAREYFRLWFERFAHLPGLTPEDRTAIKALLTSAPEVFEPRATRTVWVATEVAR